MTPFDLTEVQLAKAMSFLGFRTEAHFGLVTGM